MTNYEQTNANANKTFAIFITSYNYGEFIAQAIESVINQSDPLWNLYILDNGSTDNTYQIVQQFLKKDCRISWKQRDQNIGSIPNIIKGFQEINADYISTLQADDFLEPTFIEDAKKAFAENPEIPFCALGWSAYMEVAENKTIVQRAFTPLPKNFCGKIYLSPYVIFENFVPMHFLVFRKSCLMQVLSEIETQNLQFQQLLEPFLIKRLENIFGASYFDDSKSHGFWRRHSKQITETNIKSYQTEIEKFSEPLFFCASQNFDKQNITNIATNFMALISCLGIRKIPYRTATEWLLSDLGKSFASKFGNLDFEFIKANNLEKSLLCLAVCVWSSFIFNWGHPLSESSIEVAEKQLAEWIIDLQKQYNLRSIKAIYKEANKLYGGFLQ